MRLLANMETSGMTANKDFCLWCNVSLDLHDGHNSCELAKRKAALLEQFDQGFRDSGGTAVPSETPQ